MEEVLEVLYKHGRITYEQLAECQKFIINTSSKVGVTNRKSLLNQKRAVK